MATKPLHGLTVLVTRPTAQAQALCQGIEAAGGTVLHQAMLQLAAIPHSAANHAIKAQLDSYDIILFISANAVRYGLDALGALPAGARLACVGQQTARALAERGYSASLTPSDDFSSEGLLRLSALQAVAGQRILIVRGNGGRELLRDTLVQRGATVDYLCCYQRLPPEPLQDTLRQAIATGALDVITCSSQQALDNLLALTPAPLRAPLLRTPLLPISPRMAANARQQGFKHCLNTAANATDAAILEALCHAASTLHARQGVIDNDVMGNQP